MSQLHDRALNRKIKKDLTQITAKVFRRGAKPQRTKPILRVFAGHLSVAVALCIVQPQIAAAETADLIPDGQYYTGTVARALGGAGVAALSSAESAFMNPAQLAHLKGYFVAGYRSERHTRNVGSEQEWALAVVDVTPGVLIPGGLTYVSRKYHLTGFAGDEQDLTLNIGNKLGSVLSWGTRVRYFNSKPWGAGEVTIFTGGFGLLYTPLNNLGFGLTSDNILDNHSASIRPTTTLGANYIFDTIISFRADVCYPHKSNPDRKGIIMLGTELTPRDDVGVRLGTRIDDQIKQNFVTAGLGWQSPRFAIDFAFERRLQSADDHAYSADLRFDF